MIQVYFASIFLGLLRWPGAILCSSVAVVKSSGSEEAARSRTVHEAQMAQMDPLWSLRKTRGYMTIWKITIFNGKYILMDPYNGNYFPLYPLEVV